MGNAVYPAHYDAGWHITGTAGVFGAAAAIGKLLGLVAAEHGLGAGTGRDAGGRTARDVRIDGQGLPSRAARRRTATPPRCSRKRASPAASTGIEGPRGFAPVQAAHLRLSKVTARLGVDFDLRENTYKPFPCGIVIHPTIDACIQISRAHRIDPRDIAAVRLQVAPLVLDLCNQKDITVGLQGKFSVYHAAAIGLVRGKAGLAEFSDETVNDPQVKAVREKVRPTSLPGLAEDAVRVEIELTNGERIGKQVDHAIGNLGRPMTEPELEEKFRDQAAPMLSAARVDALIALCWKAGELRDMRELIDATLPGA